MIGRVLRIKSVEDATTILEMKNKLIVVEFGAPWCEPSRDMVNYFIESSLKHPDVIFLQIDSTKFKDYSASLGVTMVPTYCFYQHGQEVVQFSGASPLRLETELRRLQLNEERASSQELQQIVDAAWRRDYLPSGERRTQRESSASRMSFASLAAHADAQIESLRSIHHAFSPRNVDRSVGTRLQAFPSADNVSAAQRLRSPGPWSSGAGKRGRVARIGAEDSCLSVPSMRDRESTPDMSVCNLVSGVSMNVERQSTMDTRICATPAMRAEDVSGNPPSGEGCSSLRPKGVTIATEEETN